MFLFGTKSGEVASAVQDGTHSKNTGQCVLCMLKCTEESRIWTEITFCLGLASCLMWTLNWDHEFLQKDQQLVTTATCSVLVSCERKRKPACSAEVLVLVSLGHIGVPWAAACLPGCDFTALRKKDQNKPKSVWGDVQLPWAEGDEPV